MVASRTGERVLLRGHRQSPRVGTYEACPDAHSGGPGTRADGDAGQHRRACLLMLLEQANRVFYELASPGLSSARELSASAFHRRRHDVRRHIQPRPMQGYHRSFQTNGQLTRHATGAGHEHHLSKRRVIGIDGLAGLIVARASTGPSEIG